MVLSVSDFLKLPDSLKYVILVGVLAGATITISLFGITITLGEIFFIPFQAALSALNIYSTFQLFFAVVLIVLLLLFVKGLN